MEQYKRTYITCEYVLYIEIIYRVKLKARSSGLPTLQERGLTHNYKTSKNRKPRGKDKKREFRNKTFREGLGERGPLPPSQVSCEVVGEPRARQVEKRKAETRFQTVQIINK